jgi:hypothetical protein
VKITNKFNLGDIVYYPSADLRNAQVIKAEVTGIVVTTIEDEVKIVYQTGQSYGVSQEDMFKTAGPAKRRLIKVLKEKQKEIDKDISEAIKKIKGLDVKEILIDITPQENEEEEEETTEEASE